MRTFFFSAMLSHFSEDIKSFKSFGLNTPESERMGAVMWSEGNAGQGPLDHILVRVCFPLVWCGKGAGPA